MKKRKQGTDSVRVGRGLLATELVVGGSLLEEVTFELSPKGWRGVGLAQMLWGEAFKAEGTDGAKALGQKEQLEAPVPGAE